MLLWIYWLFADFPVSLLVIAGWWFMDPDSQYGAVLGYYLPYLVHGLLGAVWWYYIPVVTIAIGGIIKVRKR